MSRHKTEVIVAVQNGFLVEQVSRSCKGRFIALLGEQLKIGGIAVIQCLAAVIEQVDAGLVGVGKPREVLALQVLIERFAPGKGGVFKKRL